MSAERQSETGELEAPGVCVSLPARGQDPMTPFSSRIAAPSWMFPGTAEENVRFLSGKVRECELLCFEPEVPPMPPLAAIHNMRWHLHLPVALPDSKGGWRNAWETGAERFADVCADVFMACGPLRPWGAVLHLPDAVVHPAENARAMLRKFIDRWESNGLPRSRLLPENVKNAPHSAFEEELDGMDICFDVAHHFSYSCVAAPGKNILEKAALLHWSAPCGGDAHAALNRLTPRQMAICRLTASSARADAIHCIEVYDLQGFSESCVILAGFADPANYKGEKQSVRHV